MAQKKHTPGPWTVDPYGRYINYHNEVVGTSFFLTHETFRDEFKQEQAANMALIAAAPELLAAVKELLPYAEYSAKNHDISIIERAKAAIAKATNYKQQCDGCNGHGEVEKTVYRGDEGMEIEMDVMVECSECDGKGNV